MARVYRYAQGQAAVYEGLRWGVVAEFWFWPYRSTNTNTFFPGRKRPARLRFLHAHRCQLAARSRLNHAAGQVRGR
jgi:hypothetical protein